MKMILDTSQRKLLKLRSSIQLSSGESEGKTYAMSKTIVDKDKMLDLFVENIRIKKQLDYRDKKLLKITGLGEVIDILKERDDYYMDLKLGKKH